MPARMSCSVLPVPTGPAGAVLAPVVETLAVAGAAAPVEADDSRPAAAGVDAGAGAGAGVDAAAGPPDTGADAVRLSIIASTLLVPAMNAGAPSSTVNCLPCSCCSLQTVRPNHTWC